MTWAISSSDQPIERAAVIAPSNARRPWMYSNEAFNRSARIFSARVGIRPGDYGGGAPDGASAVVILAPPGHFVSPRTAEANPASIASTGNKL